MIIKTEIMNILKFYAYIFYRLKNYYELWHAIVIFVAIIAFNLMSLVFLYTSITHSNIKDVFFLGNSGYFQQRFYILVVDLLPIYIIIYGIYKFNLKKINRFYTEFNEESETKKKYRSRSRLLYFVASILLFIFSIISSSFF